VSLLVVGEVLGRGSVDTSHDNVVALVGFQGHLLNGAEGLLAQLLDLVGVDDLGSHGAVNAAGLDGDHEVATVLNEVGSVKAEDTSLIGLGHIGEDHVDHGDEHAVLLGVARVLNDGDNVGALLSHVDQVAAYALRELDGVDGSGGANQVGDVRAGSARGSAKVEDLAARLHVDVADSANNAGRNLGSEGVPDAVFDLILTFLALITCQLLPKCTSLL